MTTISIISGGTRGDVQPYVALGKGLRSAGYDVSLLASENFETLATEAGLTFCSMGPSVEDLLQSDEWRQEIDRGNFLSILSRMQKEMKRAASESAKALPPLLQGSALIITGLAGLSGGFSVAEILKIPVIQAYVVPFTPTREYPAPLVARLPLGQVVNRLSFHIMRQMFWQSFKVGDIATRKMLGMGKPSFWDPYRDFADKQIPMMFGYSKHVLPRPHDWPQNHPENPSVTGYWFLEEPDGWRPPVDLVDFLNAGTPPVYIGFGSMGSRNPEEAGQIALEALAQSGQRGVLASGWGGLKSSDLPNTVHQISSLPHTWLFSRMAAVVHHGGAGTTAASLRAGAPTVIVPFMGDQPFWGQRVADLGVGPTPIPRKQLTAKRLAQAIVECVSNETLRRKAEELGQKIRAEDGIGNAVAIVDRITKRA